MKRLSMILIALLITAGAWAGDETKYPVLIDEDMENGTVVADKDYAAEGETVTLTIVPAESYQLVEGTLTIEEVAVTGQADAPRRISGTTTIGIGNFVDATDNGDGTWSFTMPKYGVLVRAEFAIGIIYYNVNVEKNPNAVTTADTKQAAEGETVTVTVKPDKGYAFRGITVTDANKKEVETAEETADPNAKRTFVFTFTMPASDVTVSVEVELLNKEGYEPTPDDPNDGNSYQVTDPDNFEVTVTDGGVKDDSDNEDKHIIIIPEIITDKETGDEYTVTSVDPEAFKDKDEVTDVFVENEKDIVEIDGGAFVEDMPDAKLHVYQTLLGDYADAMPELLDGHKLVTDIENTTPEFTFSNATNVLLPEGVQQFICQYQTTSGNAPAVAAAPAAAIVKATLVPDQVVTAHNGVMLQGETGVKEYAAVKDAGNGNYEGNELKAIEKATVINHEHGAYMLEGKAWEHIWDEFVIIGDGKAILLVKDVTNLPEELEYELDVTTGIRTIDNSPLINDNCYTIQGYKVTKSQSNMLKGVYIVNGKKMVVK